jgi:hypothetical protein
MASIGGVSRGLKGTIMNFTIRFDKIEPIDHKCTYNNTDREVSGTL